MLVDGDTVLAAKLFWPGSVNAGTIVAAKLVTKRSGSRRGLAQTVAGTEILLDNLPTGVTEGASIHVRITRAPISERGRLKMAIGRYEDPNATEEGQSRGIEPNDAQGFFHPMAGVDNVRQLPRGHHLDNRWDEVWHAASLGQIEFAAGNILVTTTPAMTVIDVDGEGSPRELALAAVPAIVRALHWFDIGGNIGIDFPTIAAKQDRKAVDAELAKALADWPHERTAMNGFGFVQLVARLEGPSLLHRFATARVGMCARYALRVAECTPGAGMTLLTVHPALKAKLKPEWQEELIRRTGRKLQIDTNPSLALEAPSAQVVNI